MTALRIEPLRVELLRPGPAHNQLLSPLVSYLAICGQNAASTIHLAWEHRHWLERLRTLRYDPDATFEPDRRIRDLAHTADGVTDLFCQIDGLVDRPANQPDEITHLRLVIAPAELAALPFELAWTPTRHGRSEVPMIVDPHRRTMITREVRFDGSKVQAWPRAHVRVLFAWASSEHDTVPVDDHLAALSQALRPWTPPRTRDVPPDEPIEDFDLIIQVLPEATLDQILEATSEIAFTHIHILAHGVAEGSELTGAFALVLRSPDGGFDHVSGARLAAALRPTATAHRGHCPSVVTLASCDAGGTRGPIVPGASIAQALHASGIPLVVGSQFPLTKTGSVLLTHKLYTSLLAGEHPVLATHRAREALYARMHTNHDWASMVVYARLPDDLDEQLPSIRAARSFERLRVLQRRARRTTDKLLYPHAPSDRALTREEASELDEVLHQLRSVADQVARQAHDLEQAPVARAETRAEAWGLVASAHKRVAELTWARARDRGLDPTEEVDHRLRMRAARDAYERVTETTPTQHWSTVQAAVCEFLLEGELTPQTTRRLAVARWFAEQDQEVHPSGLSSLCEIELLDVDHSGDSGRRAAVWLESFQRRVEPRSVEWESTMQQLDRYHQWWADEQVQSVLRGARELSRRAQALRRHRDADATD